MTVRVRIAPSPTGFAHIGTARTALFNWLFARHHGGAFIVRIEDTDRKRLVPGAVESIFDMLRWLGLDVDEGPYAGGEHGPYYQSERLDVYQRDVELLLANGWAYRCYCSPERLAAVNAEKQRNKQPPGYDRHCRFMSDEERQEAECSGVTPVVRLAVPLEGKTVFQDAIRGEIEFDNATLQDTVLMKSDGYPTYQLAATVDDHHMQITHVMRGDEWISSTPLHILINEAFDWQPPIYAHLPLILGKDRAKLSKRHGDTSFQAFIDQGYLPEAVFNFLGLLGWSLDDKTEFITREEFIEHFDLDRVVKNPAVFDFDKLNWMNGEYMRRMDPARFAALLQHWLEKQLPPELAEQVTPELVARIAPLAQTRIERLDQAAPTLAYLFPGAPLEHDRATLLGKRFADKPEQVLFALDEVCSELEDVEDWVPETILEALYHVADRMEIKRRDFFGPFYVAITGRQAAPPLNESMALLGKKLSLERIRRAIEKLQE